MSDVDATRIAVHLSLAVDAVERLNESIPAAFAGVCTVIDWHDAHPTTSSLATLLDDLAVTDSASLISVIKCVATGVAHAVVTEAVARHE